MSTTAKDEQSRVAQWYKNRSIFITGSSGFMGKILLEKLLYSCPQIAKLYILIRPKRGKSVRERIDAMFELPMFERLNKKDPKAREKIVCVEGDLVSEGLGIAAGQRQELVKNISVVFHMAATLRLEGTLKDAVDMNVLGTKRVIELCQDMKQLKALVHLSTAFCNSDIKTMDEKVYPSRMDPEEIIRTVNTLSEDALLTATPGIIAPHPNTYIFTKRLAEILMEEQYPKLPIAVTRPSIVGPTAMEPVSGWVDNLNGPIGLLVGAGKGVIRTMKCNGNYPAHTVPADIAINALIAIGWQVGLMNHETRTRDQLPVYNMSQDGVVKVTFGDVLNIGREIIYDYPFEWCIWYPGGDITTSDFLHKLYVVLFHYIPAYFLDFLLMIFGQKRFMVRVQNRITLGLELLEFFTTNYWDFKCKNFYELWEKHLIGEDKRRFSMDFQLLDTKTYLKISILGARQYCVKEDLSSLPRCRLKQKFLYVLHKAVVFTFYYFVLSTIASIFPPLRYLMDKITNTLSCFMDFLW